jgi:hypothetical protein
MVKNVHANRLFSAAILLIGMIFIVEAAATAFVVAETDAAEFGIVAWTYVIIKAFVGIFAIFVGIVSRNN